MNSIVKVRVASADDAEDIAAIYAPIVRDTVISFEAVPPSAFAMAERIEKILPTHPWLVAVSDGRVAGYVYAGEHRQRAAYRWSVDVTAYIAEEARGHRVASTLYHSLLGILQAQGFHSAFAGIALPNTASVALHESFGFKSLGVYREVGHKFGKWHDVGWWQLGLSAGSDAPSEPTPFQKFRETGAFMRLLG